MKFTAIVGNPPYQILNEGDGAGADPLYHYFIDVAQVLGEKVSLIHPARFLFNAGKTPKAWNAKMLSDKHFKIVKYWENSQDIFDNVDIKGGVAISYWDAKETFEPIKIFCKYDQIRTLLAKVSSYKEPTFDTIVGPREEYSFTNVLYEEHPGMINRQSKGHKYSLGSNAFELFPELFEEPFFEIHSEKALVYGRVNNQRCYKQTERRYLALSENFENYKVIIAKANGSGKFGEPLSYPIIGGKYVAYTDTFIGIGNFQTKEEAEACLKYIKTKFARTLLSTLRVTHITPRETWANVPLQQFTSPDSDIDWSRSIADIDRQLYAKYGLTDDEIAFIEKTIKPME